MVANKVTHIINCAGKQIQNHWEPIGVAYLTFFWLDQDNQVSFGGMVRLLVMLIDSVLAGFVGPEGPKRRGLQRHL